MAQTLSKNYWTFVRGLITEASPLTFPENASLDEENFVLNVDGSRQRRLGLQNEEDNTGDSFAPDQDYFTSTNAHNVFKWRNPGGINNFNLVVVQTGRYVSFFEEGQNYNDGIKSFQIDLDLYKVDAATTADVAGADIDVAFGKGKLIIVGKYIEPLKINYRLTDDLIDIEPQILLERDLEGLDDGLRVDERPATLSDEHNYNLQNQGWTVAHINDWDTARSDFPSNADIEFLGYHTQPSTGLRVWDEDDVVTFPTNTPAPRGHFIREVFNPQLVQNFFGASFNNTNISPGFFSGYPAQVTVTVTTASPHGLNVGDTVLLDGAALWTAPSARYSVDGVYTVETTPLTTTYTITVTTGALYSPPDSSPVPGKTYVLTPLDRDPESFRPTASAFFAGRVWYGGTESTRLGDFIYFSQLVEHDEGAFSRMYQAADPTAEEDSQLVATDGGSVKIPGLGFVRKLLPLGQHLVVFSSAGVWSIGPGSESGFKADSFSARQISTVGCSSKNAVVYAEGIPLFWSDSGIYVLEEDKISGFLTAKSITAPTIQTYFNSLTQDAILTAKGVYDDNAKKIYWLHKDSDGAYTQMLVFDLLTSAFSKYTLKIPEGDVEILALDAVTQFVENEHKIKVLYSDTDEGDRVYYWAEFTNTDFKDFASEDAAAFVVTGYELLEDARKPKFSNYIHCFFERTETGFVENGSGGLDPVNASACLMQAQWDFHNTSSGGKFGATQQVYRYRRFYIPENASDTYDTGERMIITKTRVRGMGRALSLKFSTQPGKDCHLLGWTVGYVGAAAE